jgi:pyruvate dehydrogenase E2 component (dihydrolipoamide acetyltransferase)
MSFAITIPRLGWSMEEGTLVRWLKNDGDFVQAGDAVFELEGEKAAQDIEAVDSGFLRIPADSPRPGSVVAVGATIGFLVAEGESVPSSVGAPPTASSKPVGDTPPGAGKAERAGSEVGASKMTPATRSVPPAIPESTSPAFAPPSVRRLAREKGVALSSLTGSGPAGRITLSDVQSQTVRPRLGVASACVSSAGAQMSVVASPRARRVAKELGIDWRRLTGTGRDGRVRESDVRRFSENPQAAGGATVAVSSRRRTIANRMLASREQTASVTLTTRIDATNLVGLRQQFKQSANGSLIPSYSDIIVKLVSLALQQHPLLAVRAEGEHWIAITSPDEIHIGVAVDTEEGLIVPVVREVGTLGLFELANRTKELIERARSGALSMSEMQGGVFTITNLGSFGIDAFTPIINVPETAILGLGRIRREPVVLDDQIVARDQMTLSLTFDHRIVDGAPAARFLQVVSQAIENPSAWLIRGD